VLMTSAPAPSTPPITEEPLLVSRFVSFCWIWYFWLRVDHA
jgi:hypothetical protein